MTSKTRVDFFIRKLKWVDQLAVDSLLSAMEVRVGVALASYLNSNTGDTFVGRETLASKLGVNVKSIDRAIVALERAGYLTVARSRGRGNSNTYTMAFPEKATLVSPFTSDDANEKATFDDLKGDISDAKRRHPGGANLSLEPKEIILAAQHSDSGREIVDAPASAMQAKPAERPQSRKVVKPNAMPTPPSTFASRGQYEVQIASILGPDGWDILGTLEDHKVSALCRRLANGRLTKSEILSVIENHEQRKASA